MALADRAATTATKSADRPAVVAYKGALILHRFMTRGGKDADGKFVKREATGEVALVYRICPVLADGTTTTSGAIWLWLEAQRKESDPPKLDPSLLRAFRASLAGMAQAIDAIEDEAVADGDWKPLTAPAPKADAPKPKGLAAKAARAAAEADGAKSVDLDSAVSDLPF